MKNLKRIKSGNFDKLLLSSSEEIVEFYLNVEILDDVYLTILQEIAQKDITAETVEYVLNKNNIQVEYKTFSKIFIKPFILAYKYTDYLGDVKKQHELIDCQFKYLPAVQSGKPSLALFLKFTHQNEVIYINKAIVFNTEEELSAVLKTIETEILYVEKIKTDFVVKLLNQNLITTDFLR